MTDLTTPASDAGSAQASPQSVKPAIAIALAALADWLFYGHQIGISAVAFALALALGSLAANFASLNRSRLLPAAAFVLAGLIPAIEEFNAASLILMILALGIALLLTTNPQQRDLGGRAAALCDLYLVGPFRFFRDAVGLFNLPALKGGLTVWLVPIALGGVFVFLLVSANPLLEKWIRLMSPGDAASYVSLGRILFWTVALSVIWPFVQVWWRRKVEATSALTDTAAAEPKRSSQRVEFFGVATILRSLVLFNLLFAVQTILDAVYLWDNVALPADISYASYAHRGAYPLIVTALLAAGFVLAAIRPGGPAEQSRVVRPLVYLWVAQNVLLVLSSILRLDLYVQVYLLTWWRVAAFIWMILVALGLILIVARIVLNRSNDWLIRANLIALTATLYICSLVNFAAIIADYNVSHSREATGKGVSIDMNYLLSLGPQALPAIDRAIALHGIDPTLVSRRGCLVEQQLKDTAFWRSWGFRSWRLQRAMGVQPKSSTAG
ncbi:DUF4173 domain-containing protein [Bradyrhizobium sp. CB3481]|uniref:DUF4153 domain-containing protein n=1 Tax=Bradyrhizobium sp. CB3481 TaxID=3039158 RepID=UPI0024B23AC5|nr:DUF4173 domain-containing protein [Bradyrhizobium sp. CB3481]WFU18853.1 DUF4173 domain-containing protein [Bradyrhizobium sp. CB3481]